MKNITKLFAVLVSSIVLVGNAIAGEMSVTGSAKASYRIGGEDLNGGKAIGVANELTVSASGELDNGFTWNYAVDLDDANAVNDDTQLTIGTPYGTIGFFASEGGLSTEYSNLTGALGAGSDYANISGSDIDREGYDVSDYGNIQYHTPADLLPFGIAAKIGYAPNMANTGAGASYKAVGSTQLTTQDLGGALTGLQVSAAPIDGLSIAGDIHQTKNQTGTTTATEEGISANLGAKYTMGQFTVGYYEGGYQDAVAAGELIIYEKDGYSLQFDATDSLSFSISQEEISKGTRVDVANGASAGTKTIVTNEIDSVQVAYTMGGLTLGLARVDESNIDFGSTTDENTILSVAVAF
jgi:hypothetical protein